MHGLHGDDQLLMKQQIRMANFSSIRDAFVINQLDQVLKSSLSLFITAHYNTVELLSDKIFQTSETSGRHFMVESSDFIYIQRPFEV